jgi:hypothetical protein
MSTNSEIVEGAGCGVSGGGLRTARKTNQQQQSATNNSSSVLRLRSKVDTMRRSYHILPKKKDVGPHDGSTLNQYVLASNSQGIDNTVEVAENVN